MSTQARVQKPQSPVVPIFLVNFVLRLRRFLLRAADAVVPPYLVMLDHFMGAATTSMLHSAVQLHIPDLLSKGPLSVAELAQKTETSPDMLDRMLRALVSMNVFRRLSDGRYANNNVSANLITGALGGTRGFSEFFGKEEIIRSYLDLPNTLRDGVCSFDRVNGKSVWDWMASDDTVRAAFVEGMSAMTEVVSPSIAANYPFDEVNTVCDVGGGVGIVLTAVLRRHPHLKGILYDSEAMLNEAKPYLADWGVADRVELKAGSFFDSIPHGADAYILKTVLHNWNDANAKKILRNCRAVMNPGQRLLVPDFLDVPDPVINLVPYMDIAGMMVYSGRERPPEVLAGLFKETGFKFGRTMPLPGCQAVFEGIAV